PTARARRCARGGAPGLPHRGHDPHRADDRGGRAVADRDPPAAVGLTARPRAAEPGEPIDSPHKAQTHGRKAERMTSSTPAATADIGVIGLAVMGSNLARNLARNGYTVALYNRTHARTTALVSAHGGEGTFV